MWGGGLVGEIGDDCNGRGFDEGGTKMFRCAAAGGS